MPLELEDIPGNIDRKSLATRPTDAQRETKKRMPSSTGGKTPIIEPNPAGEAEDLTYRNLRQRIRQQEILAELGVSALQGAEFDQLLNDTARLTAEGLRTPFCKVLEYIPAENGLLVRAGVGWDAGVVGVSKIGADLESPAGFALKTGKPVISNHLENEERFRTPEILWRHGIHRAMNVILQGDGRPFGVLEVDSRDEDEFVENDLAFLQGAANILGMAIERQRYERNLQTALDRQQVLLKEMNHRIKNSLSIIASMLRLQGSDSDDGNLKLQLDEASQRVSAVAKAHELLYRGDDIERMDIGAYIESICEEVDASVSHCEIVSESQKGIVISTDRAISAALIVNELISNAAKYAYPEKSAGKIYVRTAESGSDHFAIWVRDEGVGLPDDFNVKTTGSLGMRIVVALTQQLGGVLSYNRTKSGTEFVVTVPRSDELAQPPR